LNKNPYLDAAKAEDLGSLLDHIGWTEVLRPALIREKEVYTKLLVSSTLGMPVTITTATGPVSLSQEQLAGKIYGIDYILDVVEKILSRGARAVAELRSRGVNLSSYLETYGNNSNPSSS